MGNKSGGRYMKSPYLALVACLFAAGSANAQQSAVEEAVEAAAAAAEAQKNRPAPQQIHMVPTDSPPPAPMETKANPEPKSWRLSRGQAADYPPSSWAADEEGVVNFRVQLDRDGKVTMCEITTSSGYPTLDAKTCEIQKERGEYYLDRDESGEPIEVTYEGQQVWEKREHEFPGTSAIEVTFDVLKTGETTNCEFVEVSGEISQRTRDQLERRPCPFSSRNGRNIYRDENGVPVPKKVTFRVEVTVEDPE